MLDPTFYGILLAVPPSPEGTGVYITGNTTYRPGYTQAYCKGTPLDADARNAQGSSVKGVPVYTFKQVC